MEPVSFHIIRDVLNTELDIGNLGTSVSLSLQDNLEFKVRALSRDPGSEKAQRLVAKGIEVVKADNWKADELLEAFKGCWGVFINIDSDAPVSRTSTVQISLAIILITTTEFQATDWPKRVRDG